MAPFKEKWKLQPEHYAVVVRAVGRWIRAVNYDLKVEISEEMAPTREERLLQMMRLVQMAQVRIEQKLETRVRLKQSLPAPIETENLFSTSWREELTVKETSALLGEAPHVIRQMGDAGELSVRRTRKGHRRFLKKEVEERLAKSQIACKIRSELEPESDPFTD